MAFLNLRRSLSSFSSNYMFRSKQRLLYLVISIAVTPFESFDSRLQFTSRTRNRMAEVVKVKLPPKISFSTFKSMTPPLERVDLLTTLLESTTTAQR